MKIFAISDTHAAHRDIVVPEGDVFIFAGDMSVFNKNIMNYIDFNNWLGEIPCRYKIVIAGNHDVIFQRNKDKVKEIFTNCIYLQDESVVIDGFKFYGSPWQPEFGGWAFNLQRGIRLAETWKRIPEDTDVLITHGPPKQICDWNGSEEVGCEDLLKRVFEVKPKLHIFGHIHQSRGKFKYLGKTLFVNVAMNDTNKVYEIDLDEKAELIGEENG